MNTHLVLDATNICYRNFFASNLMRHEDVPTSVIYMFFRDIIRFREQFNTDKLYFCFDKGPSKRKKFYPEYKANRKDDPDMAKKKLSLFSQLHELCDSALGEIGFRNIYAESGYEADDLIANVRNSVCSSWEYPKEQIVIISGDKDLYQLINQKISVYSGTKDSSVITLDKFREKYEINPEYWAIVKAIAGCTSDNIKGIDRVGEKTSIKYLNKQLSSTTLAYKNIISKEGESIIKRNLKLVQLPFADTPELKINTDELDPHKWNKVMKNYGCKSLMNMANIGVKQ